MDKMVSAYKEMWNRWSDFSGRSGVGKYWWAALVNAIIVFLIYILAFIFAAISETLGLIVMLVVLVYALALIVPGLAMAIRRLHDTDRSGWWILINFVPIVGPIILIVFLASASTEGPNQYGMPDTPVVG